MELKEKTTKLLGYSLIVSAEDKKMWLEQLPKMDDGQVQVLYGVLVDEVKAWKKEGISILHDNALEIQLLPTPEHGASLDNLKAMLSGKPVKPEAPKPAAPPPAPKPAPPAPPPPPKPAESAKPEEKPEDDFVLGKFGKKDDLPDPAKSAWMLSNTVVVPKSGASPSPSPRPAPKIRNRVARHGLAELAAIRSVDDLKKVEAAHLRQGPLREQLAFIRQRITQLARENDILPVSVIPVFEQSPLFRTYLKAGSMMIENNTGDTKVALDQVMAQLESQGEDILTQEEFEGIADLRKELDTVAGL